MGGTGATSASAARTALGISRANLNDDAVVQTKSGAYTTVLADRANLLRFTAAATLSLTAAATLTADWFVDVIAAGGAVTVDPNGSEQVDGATTVAIPQGMAARVYCDGTAFFTTLLTAVSVGQVNATGMNMTSADDGATAGPKLDLYRNSASPADGDVLGLIEFNGNDESGDKDAYAYIEGEIVDATDGTEDGRFRFSTVVNGSRDTRMFLGAGLSLGTPTGGDKGTGTLNATGVFVNNVAVLTANSYAALSFGAVGTYCFVYTSGTTGLVEGATVSGSTLKPAGLWSTTDNLGDDGATSTEMTKGGNVLSGTWRMMGRANAAVPNTDSRVTLALRIS
jgi:hypothetical protein